MATSQRNSRRLHRRWLVALTLVALVLGPAASADETSPSRREVRQAREAVAAKESAVASVEAQLAAANQRLEQAATRAEQAAEAYNGAQWALQQATAAAEEADRQARAAERRVASQRDQIALLVTDSYEGAGPVAALGAVFRADGPESLMSDYLSYEGASGALESGYAQFAAASALAESFREQALEAQQAQAQLADQAKAALQKARRAAASAQTIAAQTASAKAELVRELAKARGISVRLAQARQQALEKKAAEEAAAKAAAEAAEQDKNSGSGSGNPAPPPVSSDPPASSGSAQRALDFARAQLGEPYEWGAAGPDSWDCSGLTMASWGSAGVSLPHYSVAQYYVSTPISVSDLRPGDLVFWGTSNDPDSIHHVALYLGNGQIIHAPRTGENVRIDSIYYWTPPNFFGRV